MLERVGRLKRRRAADLSQCERVGRDGRAAQTQVFQTLLRSEDEESLPDSEWSLMTSYHHHHL